MLQDGVEAFQQIAEFVGRERPAPRFRLNDDLGTHLQVVTHLNAEGPAEAILEIVEIVIGHAATRGCVSLRSTHPRRPAFEAEHADAIPPQHPMRDRSAPQNGLSAAKQERSGSTNGAGNGSVRARPYAPPIDPIFGSGIAIMPPARIPGRLTSSRLVGSSRSVIFSQRDPHLPVVWRVCHIPPGKLPRSFDNLSMHSCEQERMAGAELSASPSQGGCEGPLPAF